MFPLTGAFPLAGRETRLRLCSSEHHPWIQERSLLQLAFSILQKGETEFSPRKTRNVCPAFLPLSRLLFSPPRRRESAPLSRVCHPSPWQQAEWISQAVSISKRGITGNLDVFYQLSWQGGQIICTGEKAANVTLGKTQSFVLTLNFTILSFEFFCLSFGIETKYS